MNQIIEYLTQNGVMEPGRLNEQPFTQYSTMGLDGVFAEEEASEIVQALKKVNGNAEVRE